jgi:hypothetical protein
VLQSDLGRKAFNTSTSQEQYFHSLLSSVVIRLELQVVDLEKFELREADTRYLIMIGKYGGFNPPRYSFQLRAASIGLGAGMWWYFLSMGTDHGAYTFVRSR